MSLDPRAPMMTVLLGAPATVPPLAMDTGLPAQGTIVLALGVPASGMGLVLWLSILGFAAALPVATAVVEGLGPAGPGGGHGRLRHDRAGLARVGGAPGRVT